MQYLVKLMQFSTFISAFYHKGIRVYLSGNLTYVEFIVQRENALLIDYKVFFYRNKNVSKDYKNNFQSKCQSTSLVSTCFRLLLWPPQCTTIFLYLKNPRKFSL